MTTIKPPYSGGWEVPDATQVAWGARLIIDQDGHTDLLWDRQGITPEQSADWPALQVWLDRLALKRARANLSTMLKSNKLSTREDREVVLYDDGHGIIRGNPRRSAGYCYVVAYLKEDNDAEADS